MTSEARGKLDQLVQTCAKRAWRLAYLLVWNAHDAHDVVQEAFLVAARKAAAVPGGDPWYWFAKVLALEAKRLRKRRARAAVGLNFAECGMETQEIRDIGPEGAAVQAEQLLVLREALAELPEETSSALALTHVSDLSYRDAAAVLGISSSAVNRRVNEGLEQLRRRLGAETPVLTRGLAILPIADPAMGWEQAIAGWSSAAKAQLTSVTSGVPTTLGGTLVAKYAAVTLTLIVVGLLLWMFVLKPGAERPGRQANRLARENGAADPARARDRSGEDNFAADGNAGNNNRDGANDTAAARDGSSSPTHAPPATKDGHGGKDGSNITGPADISGSSVTAPPAPAWGKDMPLQPPAKVLGGRGPWDNGAGITCLTIAADGKTFLTGGNDGMICHWSIETGAAIKRMMAQRTRVKCVCFNNNGTCALAGYDNGIVRYWDLQSGAQTDLKMKSPKGSVDAVVASADGNWLAAASGASVGIWDGTTLKSRHYVDAKADIASLVIKDNTELLACGTDAVRIDLATGAIKSRRELLIDSANTMFGMNCCAVSHDGKWLAASSSDARLRVFSLEDYTLKHDIELCDDDGMCLHLYALVWRRESTQFVAAGMGGVDLWDANKGEILLSYATNRGMTLAKKPATLALGGNANALDVTPDGTRVLGASDTGKLLVWDADSAQPLAGHDGAPPGNIGANVNGLAFFPDSRALLASTGTISAWSLENGRLIDGQSFADAKVRLLAMFPDGRHALVAAGKTAFKMNLDDGRPVMALKDRNRDDISGGAISPDGRLIVTVDNFSTICLWRADDGTYLRMVLHSAGWSGINSVSFSPDGARLLTASSDLTVKVWSLVAPESDETDTPQVTIPIAKGDYASCARFSVDGTLIFVSHRDGLVTVHDANTGQFKSNLLDKAPANELVSSRVMLTTPDGRHLVVVLNVGSYSSSLVRVVEVATSRIVATLEGHDGPIYAAAVSPDGKWLATGGTDRVIKLWELPK